MNFTISEEQQSAQQLAQQILSDFTDVDKLKVIEQQQENFDTGLWQALAKAGLLGLDIAEDQGGIGLGFYSLTTLCEEVGRTVAPVPISSSTRIRRRHLAAVRKRYPERPMASGHL